MPARSWSRNAGVGPVRVEIELHRELSEPGRPAQLRPAGLVAGVPLDVAAAALATASLSEWRLELRDLAGGATLLNDSFNTNPDSTRAALDVLAALEGGRRIAVRGEMLDLGDHGAAEHRAIGEYAASRADVVVAVGEATRPIAAGAGERAVVLVDKDAAVDWLRGHLTDGDVVLVKASRGARLDEVAAALGQVVTETHGLLTRGRICGQR